MTARSARSVVRQWLGPVERRIGTTRWLAAFAAGHIGATLLVALGLIIGVRTGHIDASVAHSIDVGWSYGGVCLTGVLTYLVPCRWRGTYAAVLLAAVATGLWLNRSFTDWGHLTSALIGLAFGPKVAARRTTATTSAGERSTRVAHGDRTRGPVKMLVYVEQVAPLVLGHTPDSCLGEKRPGLVQRGEHHIPATDVVCNERKEPQQ